MKFDTATLGRPELHDLLGATISPLPIVFVSTVGPDGAYNAAPFSFATPICSKPAIICVSFGILQPNVKKDTVRNIEFSRDFVINVVDEAIVKQAVQASAGYPYGVDEMKETGLTAVKSEKVKSPRIAEAKVSLECRLIQKLQFLEEYKEGPGLRDVVFGEVVLAHANDDVVTNGKIDPRKLKLIARYGSGIYSKPADFFELKPTRLK